MIANDTFRARRQALEAAVGGPILLMGNAPSHRNLRMNAYPFRQDSTFLYYTGCTLPDAAAVLQEGRFTLFLPTPSEDDPLWNGPEDCPAVIGERLGADVTAPAESLEATCLALGVRKALAVPEPGATTRAARITGQDLLFSSRSGPDDLVNAVLAQRRIKSPEEVQEIREAVEVTANAFRLALEATRPGEHEVNLGALFDGYLASRHAEPSFHSIVTVRGEVLHNPHRVHILAAGDLLLLDAGAESRSGYCADVTRTWPVSGCFTDRQKAAYEAVLMANETAIAMCRPGVRYRDIHLAAARVLARFLRSEGLLRCDEDTALETGAHALFYPHGTGHLMGLDVHDLENFGDRAGYAPGRVRSTQFGLCYLRMDLDLEPGLVFTIEPGFYVAPEILHHAGFRQQFQGLIDYDKAETWLGFGGIRIEDDIVVTDGDPEILTAGIPKAAAEVEARTGRGSPASRRLQV